MTLRHPIKILAIAVVAGFAAPVLAQSTTSEQQQGRQAAPSGTTGATSSSAERAGGGTADKPANMQRSPSDGTAASPHPLYIGQTVTLQGTVRSIDRENRRITVKNENGETATLKVGKDVANLERLKKGDQVKARMSEAVALTIMEGGEEVRPRVEEQVVRNRTMGEQRGFGATERTTIVAEVKSIDRANNKITLIGPRNQETTMKVQDQNALQGIEKGDKVVASFVEAVALSIDGSSGSQSATSQRGAGSDGATSGSGASSQSGSSASSQSGSQSGSGASSQSGSGMSSQSGSQPGGGTSQGSTGK